MLCVRIDGHEVETTPAALARLVFEGKVDRDSMARLPGGTAEQPLEQLLGSDYGEALTSELHRRLRLICSLDSSAVDVQELCTQVEELCRWQWPSFPALARFFWAAAWLNELAGRTKPAVDFYDAFLLMPAGESHLRLLALSNRGVLQIQLGRLDGVGDLVRAATGDCGFRISDFGVKEAHPADGTAEVARRSGQAPPPSVIHHPPIAGLPAACFNLLNLINVIFSSAELLRTVDEELMDFFGRLPRDWQVWWLGETPEGDGGLKEARGANPPSALRPPPSTPGPILRDPTYRRLNMLVARLSAAAQALVADLHHPMDRPSSVFRRLSLWDCRVTGAEGSGARDEAWPPDLRPSGSVSQAGYAEAAALLLSDDIPSSLTRQDNPLARLEPSIREELTLIESHLAAGQYGLAKSRLLMQQHLLRSLEGRYGIAALLRHVETQIERIGHLEAQEGQLQLQKACNRFVAEVQAFCGLTDAGQALSDWEDLQRRLQQFRARLAPQTAGEALGLLNELAARAEHHAQELRRDRIEKTIGESLLHVRQNRPSDWTIPVPESVYRALAQCRLHDPKNLIDDWSVLQEQLDTHQGRHHTQRALSAWRSGVLWDRIENDLIQALVHRPDEWLTLAFLLGWRTEDGGLTGDMDPHPPFAMGHPPGPVSGAGSPLRVERAGRVLDKVFEQIAVDARKCLRLWQCVETTLSPALAGRDVEAFEEARALAQRCLDRWPTGSPQMPGRADPRHPVNRFLEACEKTRRLVEAEQLLGARPPRLDEAKQRLVGILQSGVSAREQLRRIVTGLYLAQFQAQDPPPVQRQVLVGLEAWVARVPPEAVPQIRGQEIVAETEKVRAAVAGRSVVGTCPA